MSHRTKTILAAVGLVAFGAAAYFNSLRGPFVFDDQRTIAENAALRRLWPVGPILAGPRPVVDLTFAINYALDRFNVPGYHLFNLAIHVLAGLTLFGIVRRTLTADDGRWTMDDTARVPRSPSIVHGPSSIVAVSFAVALLWMVHPLQTEAVTYITQRMESLMGLFYLLTLYALIRAASSPRPSAWSVAAVAACALGMGCKEVMVTAPVALLLYDRTFIAGSFREALRRRWGLYLALAATWLILARSILAAFGPHPASAGFAVPGLAPLVYARSELGVILHYLRLTLWPSGLCLDYGWPVARTAVQIVPGAIVVGGLLAATIWAVVRRSAWGFLGAWFFLALAASSSFMPIQDLACERRMYLALAAPATAAVVAAYLIGERLLRALDGPKSARKAVGWGVAVVLLSCATAGLTCRTLRRNRDYRTAVSIWQNAVDQRQENARAWNYLGAAWVEEGHPEKALECFAQAMDRRRNYADAYNNRAVAEGRMGRWDQALRDSDEAVRLKPDYAPNYYNRGKALAALNRRAEAIADYTEAIKLNLRYAEAWHSRGNAYGRINHLDDAVRDLSKAIELQPDYAEAYGDRAVARFYLKDYDEALADVKAAQRLGGQPNAEFIKALTQAAQQRNATRP
jgi:protein O-mannosyl-transferase